MAQNCPLLILPPELRNTIWEFVACNTEHVSTRDDRATHTSPLSLVCSQIRQEYDEIYCDEAPKYASVVNLHFTNFIHKLSRVDIAATVNNLPPLPTIAQRNYVFIIFLTNTFDNYLEQFRALHYLSSQSIELNSFSVEVWWNPKSFDVHYCQQMIPKLRWCLAAHGPNASRKLWWKIEVGFEDAFRRYAPKKVRAKGQKRKRKSFEI